MVAIRGANLGALSEHGRTVGATERLFAGLPACQPASQHPAGARLKIHFQVPRLAASSPRPTCANPRTVWLRPIFGGKPPAAARLPWYTCTLVGSRPAPSFDSLIAPRHRAAPLWLSGCRFDFDLDFAAIPQPKHEQPRLISSHLVPAHVGSSLSHSPTHSPTHSLPYLTWSPPVGAGPHKH